MGVKVRIRLPAGADFGSFAVAALGHLALFGALFAFAAGHSATTTGPTLTVRLSGPAGPIRGGRIGGGPRESAAAAPGGVAAPEPKQAKRPREEQESKRETARKQPRNVARKLAGATEQTEDLERVETKGKPGPAEAGFVGGAKGAGRAGSGGVGGVPGLPEGSAGGGIGGFGTDDPFSADWYIALIVNRLQDGWRDRPVLPTGSAPQRVVVAFVIQHDGRVGDAAVATPSGYAPLDASALRAVASLGKLPPLPPNYGRDRLRARFVFELLPPGQD